MQIWYIALLTILVILIAILSATVYYNTLLHGVLFVGNIQYSLLNEPIEVCRLINCFTLVGEKFNVMTRSVSHHAFLIQTENQMCIVSRITNFVQVMEIKSIEDEVITDINGYKYHVLESFYLNGITFNDFIKSASDVCREHKYSLFNHNCQEFVFKVMLRYGVVSEVDANKHVSKTKLLAQGISEILNKQ